MKITSGRCAVEVFERRLGRLGRLDPELVVRQHAPEPLAGSPGIVDDQRASLGHAAHSKPRPCPGGRAHAHSWRSSPGLSLVRAPSLVMLGPSRAKTRMQPRTSLHSAARRPGCRSRRPGAGRRQRRRHARGPARRAARPAGRARRAGARAAHPAGPEPAGHQRPDRRRGAADPGRPQPRHQRPDTGDVGRRSRRPWTGCASACGRRRVPATT